MRRYWVDPQDVEGDLIHFTKDTFHHVVEVCRMDVGSRFEVLTGDGRALFSEMISVQKTSSLARVLEVRSIAPLKKPFLHLALAVSRFHVMDAVVEKSVELGAAGFHPFFSDHSFVRHSSKISDGKLKRWEKIVRGATQQSGRGSLMELHEPCSLNEMLTQQKVGLFAYEGACERTLKEGIVQLPRDLEHLWIFVGSEGGFSAGEVELLSRHGLEPLSLGAQVLRVETACVALLSIIKYELDL